LPDLRAGQGQAVIDRRRDDIGFLSNRSMHDSLQFSKNLSVWFLSN
jgi:hypothetical protein